MSYASGVIHILVTGENRNPSLFLSQIDVWKQLSLFHGTSASISYAYATNSNSQTELEILSSRGVRLVEIESLEKSRPTWEHQSHSLAALMKLQAPGSFVLKTRPDVYISSRLFEWLLKSIQTWPQSKNPNLRSKIWTPWAHTFYPYLLDDKAFAGFAEDIEKLVLHDESIWKPIYGDRGKEAHIRRWLPILSQDKSSNEFVDWFSEYSIQKILSEANIKRMNKVSFGEEIYRKFALLRLIDFLKDKNLQDSYLSYLNKIDESIHFYPTHNACSEAFIDKWGPRMDSFAKTSLDLDFFCQKHRAWVLYSENNIVDKINNSKILVLTGMDSIKAKREKFASTIRRSVPLLTLLYLLGVRKGSFVGKLFRIMRNPRLLFLHWNSRKALTLPWK